LNLQTPQKIWLGDDIDNPVHYLLSVRGIEDPQKFLEYSTGEEQCWHDFSVICDATPAIERLKELIATKTALKAYIEIDPDCDGFCASAILYQALTTLTNWDVTYNIKNSKVHGLVLENIAAGAYDVVFVPDAGSNDLPVFSYFKEHPEQCLFVIDHHMIENEEEVRSHLPSNVYLLNSNQTIPCQYPNKALSGAGMVYRFCREVFPTEKIDYFADLAAIGIVGDVMELKDLEVQTILSLGIGRGKLNNIFFQILMDKAAFKTGGRITPFSIAFYAVPFVNAVSRMGTQEERNILFEGLVNGDEPVASTKRGSKGTMESKAEQAARMCTNVKNRQKKSRDEGVAAIEKVIAEKELLDNKILLVKTKGVLDKSLTGLVANQLASKYQKPVLLLNEDSEGNLSGSGRNTDGSGIESLKEFLEGTEYFSLLAG